MVGNVPGEKLLRVFNTPHGNFLLCFVGGLFTRPRQAEFSGLAFDGRRIVFEIMDLFLNVEILALDRFYLVFKLGVLGPLFAERGERTEIYSEAKHEGQKSADRE